MVTLNVEAPPFSLEGVRGAEVRRYDLAEYRGRWVVLFFYPADFTFVCPTEMLGFQSRRAELEQLGSAVLGISVDAIGSHQEWAKELGGIQGAELLPL